MKLISWNVNGIRAVIGKGFGDFVATEKPDILCLQETKARPEQVTLPSELEGYHAFWDSSRIHNKCNQMNKVLNHLAEG